MCLSSKPLNISSTYVPLKVYCDLSNELRFDESLPFYETFMKCWTLNAMGR